MSHKLPLSLQHCQRLRSPRQRLRSKRLPSRKQMPTTTHNQAADWVGQSIKRKEDARLVRGRGKFVDDIKLLGMLHLVFVRSPYAHANIAAVDVSEAEAMPGVVCTLTGQEITKLIDPFFEIGPPPSNQILDYPMAVDRVRYQGEPVAAV